MNTATPLRDLQQPVKARSAPPFFAHTTKRLSSWRWWAASTAVFLPFAAVFFGTRAPFSIPSVESACGQQPPDVRFYSSAAEVNEFLAACGDSGRSAYTNMQLADLAYPAVFGVFMAASLAVMFRRLNVGHRYLVGLVALPIVGTAFDYLENLFAWRALRAFPEPSGTDGLIGLASAAKTTTFWLAGVLLLATIAMLGLRTMHHRLRHRSSGASLGPA